MLNYNFENKILKGSELIAGFDLDHTLIIPKSGRKFPKDKDDWIAYGKEKLNELYNKGYKIVIFTNKANSSFNLEEFKYTMQNIINFYEIPLQVFYSTEYDYNRKPCIGMWKLLEKNNEDIKIDMLKSFYVGDAAGRKNDFSDTDYKFALNLKLQFYTNDAFFHNNNIEKETLIIPKHPIFDTQQSEENKFELSSEQEMLILVGPPGSSKSTFAKSIESDTYKIICQDDLKTKAKVLKQTEILLTNKKSVIIDRLNGTEKEREIFIDLALKYKIPFRIILFDITKEQSEHLCTYREILTGKHIPSLVINKYFSQFEKPTTFINYKLNIQSGLKFENLENKELMLSYLI